MLAMRERGYATHANVVTGECYVLTKDYQKYLREVRKERRLRREAEETFILCL